MMTRAKTVRLAMCSVVLLLAEAAHAASGRVAIYIFPAEDADVALADNLTEVAISRVAERSDRDLIGTQEVRAMLAGMTETAGDCARRLECLQSKGPALAVSAFVVGRIGRQADGFTVDLVLADAGAGRPARRIARTVSGGPELLSRAVQESVDELFGADALPARLRVESVPTGASVTVAGRQLGTTPLASRPLAAGTQQLRVELAEHLPWTKEVALVSGQELQLMLGARDLPARKTWAPHVAYGSAALAALSATAAAVFGTLAEGEPNGPTRGDAQRDLDIRTTYATTANTLWVTTGVLAAVSAATFIFLSRHISGR
jgi:hypothetical protein